MRALETGPPEVALYLALRVCSVNLTTMFIRRLHKLPFLCLLVLSLLTSPASSLGYVWCVSADGQATLETALVGDCGMDAPALQAEGSPVLALTAATDDCGPCHDISHTPRWGSARSRNTEVPVSIPAPLVPFVVAAHDSLTGRFLNSSFFVDPTPRTPDPILHHRTIVLLI